MKRDGVCIVGVQQDNVLSLRCSHQEKATVLGMNPYVLSLSEKKVFFCYRDHLRVDLCHIELHGGELMVVCLGNGSAPQADD